MVNGNQFAFIKHKHILDSVLIANECIKDYLRKKKKGLVVKLDLEKAYNRTESLDSYFSTLVNA